MPSFANFKTKIKATVNDMSFSNLFWKKFTIRLSILVVVSILAINICQLFAINYCNQTIDNTILETTISLSQLKDGGMAKDRLSTTANVVLSKAQKSINDNPFVVDSSISFYNLSKGELIAKSFEVPVIYSDEAIEWWRMQSNVKDGYPIISIDDETIKFCNRNANNTIYVEKMYCMNSVLFPCSLSAYKNNKKVDSIESIIPSTIVGQEYIEKIKFELVGNSNNDIIYSMMENFFIGQKEQFVDDMIDQPSDSEELTVSYSNMMDQDKIQSLIKNVTINEENCQIDCYYQINFWFGAWKYVAIAEILGVLFCAVGAFVNTKETLSLYN